LTATAFPSHSDDNIIDMYGSYDQRVPLREEATELARKVLYVLHGRPVHGLPTPAPRPVARI